MTTDAQRVHRQLRAVAENLSALYVHLPFCRQICQYCDYPTAEAGETTRFRRYSDALKSDFENSDWSRTANTPGVIYFGGGTPSLFPLNLLKSFLSFVGTDGGPSKVSEIALEANPEDIEKSSLESWRDIGVNRLIIGVQSFRDEVLSGLGRLHSASTAKAAIRAAKSIGIEDISVDLAFDGLIRTADGWRAELNQLVEYAEPDHISLYQIEREASQKGNLRQFWQMAKSKLGSSPYIRYHLNSWAKPESFSHYNIAVSSGADYLGLGAGAVGMSRVGDELVETRGILPVQRYLEQIPSERYTRKRLTGMDLLLDRVTRGLQTVLGVEVDRLAERFEPGETRGDAVGELAQLFERLATEGVLSSQDGRYFLPPRQLDRADQVCRLIGSRVSESHRT